MTDTADLHPAEHPYRGVKRFLIFASGANPRLLRTAQFEESTFVTLGGTVAATAVLATLSMSFAMRIALHAVWPVAIVLGMLWGLLIFNLDRWILTSSKRMRSTGGQIAVAVPRLLLAALIGIVIAEPLMLQAFKPEISQQIVQDRQERISEADQERLNGPKAQEIARNKKEIDVLAANGGAVPADEAALQAQIDRLNGELNRAEQAVRTKEIELTREVEGLASSGQSGCGRICVLKKEELRAAQELRDAAKRRNDPQIKTLTEQLNTLRETRQEQGETKETTDQERITALVDRNELLQDQIDTEFATVTQDRGDGLVSAVVAFEHLRDKNPSVRHIHLAVLLLLIAIDVLPVLGKLLQTLGEKRGYERLQDAVDRRVAAYAEQMTAEAEHQTRQWTSLLELDEQARKDMERENVQGFLRTAAGIQRRLGDIILRRWEAEQMRVLEEQELSGTTTPSEDAAGAAGQAQPGNMRSASSNRSQAERDDAPRPDPQERSASRVVNLDSGTVSFVPSQEAEGGARAAGPEPDGSRLNGHAPGRGVPTDQTS